MPPASEKVDPDIRNVLFGDLPYTEWPNPHTSATGEPWVSFRTAAEQANEGQAEQAKEKLHQILAMTNLESRHYLQAWHFLRDLGEQPPPDQAKRVYGVVVEVGLDEGLDIVAAYADLSARYLNYSGAAVIWERPDDSLNGSVAALLQAGQAVAQKIGPWEGVRPPAPEPGQVRLNFLGHFSDIVTKNERDGFFTVGLLATCPSMPGLVAGVQHSGPNRDPLKIGMLWLDAHPDFNRLSQLTDKIYVHIDLDVLDPREVMGHGNKVPNGPSSEQLARLFEAIFSRYPKASAIGFATIPSTDEGGLSLAAVNRMIVAAIRGVQTREKKVK